MRSPYSGLVALIAVFAIPLGFFPVSASAMLPYARYRTWCERMVQRTNDGTLRHVSLRMLMLCDWDSEAIPDSASRLPVRTPNAPAVSPQPTPIPQPQGLQSQPVSPMPIPQNAGNPSPYGQDGNAYSLTFSEDFDSEPDASKWMDHAWYKDKDKPKNFAVENGILKIWPEKDKDGKLYDRDLNTDGKFNQTYGYFEMEAKLPHGRWPWPAFWLLNHEGPANYRPEIDIMEAYSGGWKSSGWSDDELHPTAYGITVWPGQKWVNVLQKAVRTEDLSSGFHRYAVKWEQDRQTFYFDGKEVGSVAVSMRDPMYLILSYQFGSASGKWDETTPMGKSNAFEVNYVRAWQFRQLN